LQKIQVDIFDILTAVVQPITDTHTPVTGHPAIHKQFMPFEAIRKSTLQASQVIGDEHL
jgi:hypothetical protein